MTVHIGGQLGLKEIKKLTQFARKAGVKSISLGDIKIEFKDEILIQHPRKRKLSSVTDDKTIPAPPPLPTLDEINKYIYEDQAV